MGAVIFARRYEGWADFGADGDPELLLDEIELLRSTLGLSEAVRTATGRHNKGDHDASGATQRAPDAEAVPEDVPVLQSESSAEEASPAAGGGSSSERMAGEPEAAAGGRGLRRNRSDDGGGEPTNPAAKVRAGRAPGRPPNGAGRGRGKKQYTRKAKLTPPHREGEPMLWAIGFEPPAPSPHPHQPPAPSPPAPSPQPPAPSPRKRSGLYKIDNFWAFVWFPPFRRSQKPEMQEIHRGLGNGAARTPWPTASSRHPSSAPRTTWSKPARGTWRT